MWKMKIPNLEKEEYGDQLPDREGEGEETGVKKGSSVSPAEWVFEISSTNWMYGS